MTEPTERFPQPLPYINHFKLALPRSRGFMPRDRLSARLRDIGLATRVTLLCADAGYGKTVLLREFAETAGAEVVWYSLDDSDADVVQIVGYLVQALGSRLPGFAAGSDLSDARSISALDPDHIAFLLARELDSLLTRPIAIVLDSYEKVNQSREVNRLISRLVEMLPEQVHLFIGTRECPDLPLSLLRSRGDLLELGSAELALNPGEIRELLSRIFGLTLPDSELRLLEEKTEGWAAAIVMAGNHLRHGAGTDAEDFLRDLYGGTRMVYQYFFDEVFARQSAETQWFLMKTAILPRLDINTCAVLTGASNAYELLDGLQKRGLFTSPIGGQNDCYRYHRLFREFLLERLRIQSPPEEITAIHLKAATVLEARGEFGEALQQYVLASEVENAANLLERVADEYLEHGRLDTVQHWLRRTPDEVATTRPWLLAVNGKALRRAGDNVSALERLERAYRLFEQQGNQRGLAWVASELGTLYSYEERFAEAVELGERLLARLDLGHKERARIHIALSLNYLGQDESDRAEQRGNSALSELELLSRDSEVLMLTSRALRRLALAQAQEGRLRLAQLSIERGLEICGQANLSDYERARAYGAYGQVLALSGELQAALQALKDAEDAGGGRHYVLWGKINLARGNAHRDLGDYSQAAEAYSLAGDRGLFEHAFLLLRQGEMEEALSMARRALRALEARPSPVDVASARTTLGLVLDARGEADLAIGHLRSAIGVFDEKRAPQRLASTYLHLAYMGLASGKTPTGLEDLEAALEVAAGYDLCHFNWWDPIRFAFLAGQAIKHDIHTHHVSKILRVKFAGRFHTQLSDLLIFPDAGVQDFVDRILKEVADDRSSTRGDEGSAVGDLLRGCSDGEIREKIMACVLGGILTFDDLLRLRNRHRLTWREVEVYCAYYLRNQRGRHTEGLGRKHYADSLSMAENTLKVHISSIRRKLAPLGVPEDDWNGVRPADHP